MITLHGMRRVAGTPFEYEAEIEWGSTRAWYRICHEPDVVITPEFPQGLYDAAGWFIRPLTETIGQYLHGKPVEFPQSFGA